jgi:polygalacturonase
MPPQTPVGGRLKPLLRRTPLLLVFVLSHAVSLPGAPALVWEGDPIAPIKAPFPMPALERPTIPNRVVSLSDFGAVPGGEVKNTEAFARAIEALAAEGGGRLVVPPGRWLTGPIHLRGNLNLHLEEGATIVFSDVFADYLPVVFTRVGGVELYNYSSLIYARDSENIAITGRGKLDGNARAWWPWKPLETRAFFEMGAAGVPVEERVFGTEEAAIRPSFINFVNCRNILLEGFEIGGGPNWTIHPIYCENIIIRRLFVNTDGPNNDGVDPDSCRNVLIEHCRFNTGDDCVVLKSGYNEDGWRVGRPTENVVMRWCYSNRGHGGMVIGSEMSGDVRNVYVHDCTFEGTDRALRIKSMRGRGGVVENIWAENLVVRDLRREVITLNMEYGSDPKAPSNLRPPVFRNINVRNVVGTGAPTAVIMRGLEDTILEDILIEDMNVSTTRGIVMRHARGVTFRRVAVKTAEGPVFDLEAVRDLTIDGTVMAEGEVLRLR